MRTSWFALVIVFLCSPIQAEVTIPDCSLDCLTTIVPDLCGSLTNVTCLCTNTVVTSELTACAYSACNITELMELAHYRADTCGVKNDRSRVEEQLRLYYVMPALTVIFVALRLFARKVVDVGVKADDYMMLGAEVAFLTDVATGLVMMSNKFGEHIYFLSTKELSGALEFFYISELFYMVTLACTKLSLLLFFRRIFPNQTFRTLVWIMFGFVLASNFAVLMAAIFQCVPVHGNWTNWTYAVAPVKCINSYALIFASAGLSIAQDLIILIMPLPVLWQLNLALPKKLNVLVMFSMGSFVIMCSSIRLPSIVKLQSSSDPSYDQAPIARWTHLEQSIGIICGCLPACRSLVSWAFPSLKRGLKGSGKETPAYSLGSSKNSKVAPRPDLLDREFIELDEQRCQEDEGERERGGSVMSRESQIPFGETLVPNKGKNMGSQTYINVTEKPREQSRGSGRRSSDKEQ